VVTKDDAITTSKLVSTWWYCGDATLENYDCWISLLMPRNATARSSSYEAIDAYLDLQQWQLEHIKADVAQADAGEFVFCSTAAFLAHMQSAFDFITVVIFKMSKKVNTSILGSVEQLVAFPESGRIGRVENTRDSL
jgi:hypothetical protein